MPDDLMKYDENPEFLEFLTREFDTTADSATIEELAEFAFGSLGTAVEAFKKSKKQ
ncbi:MAG: hypothetical protein ABII09_03805 [Planctomycetota bacterium]